MKLYEIAHSRTGDKGNISTISLIPYEDDMYDILAQEVTEEKVLEQFRNIGATKVERYLIPSLHSMNFVVYDTLGGGVTRSLALDTHGKSLSSLLLEMDIKMPCFCTVKDPGVDNKLSLEIQERKDLDNRWKDTVCRIARAYDPAAGKADIIFYGASNFSLWASMEEDLKPYSVQNHAFGGSTDKELLLWAEYMLYPYHPKYVFFQTGSNDYVESPAGTDRLKVTEAMEFKKIMFETLHEKLPDTVFIVMSGILLPGRAQYVDMTLDINDRLEAFCNTKDYMHYVDAEALTYDRKSGKLADHVENLFLKDQIHLTNEARRIWAGKWILPTMEKMRI